MDKIPGMKVVIPGRAKARMMKAFGDILDSGHLMWGQWQERLVAKFKNETGRAYGVTFNSATSALEVVFRWLDKNRSAVWPPAVAFQATAFPSPVFAAKRAGLDVVFVDVDPATMAPSYKHLEEAFAQQPFEIYCPQWTAGFMPANYRVIKAWCEENKVIIIEDASHAAGSVATVPLEILNETGVRWPAGQLGYASVFSLAATKPLQTGQGGMLLTDIQPLVEYAFQMKNYGRDAMFQRGQYVHQGFNMHMTELQAAVGAILFDHMKQAISRRRDIAFMIGNSSGLEFLGNWSSSPNFYKLVARLPENVSRAVLYSQFAKFDVEIGSSVYDFVTPHLDVFEDQFRHYQYPGALEHVARHFCIPCHNGMDDVDVARVVEACRSLSPVRKASSVDA